LKRRYGPQAGYGDGLPRPLLLPDPDGNAVNDFPKPQRGGILKPRTQRSEGLGSEPHPIPFPSRAPRGRNKFRIGEISKTVVRASRGVGRALSGLFCVGFVLHPGAAQGCAPGYRIRPFQGLENGAN